eukprot:gene12975-12758_t
MKDGGQYYPLEAVRQDIEGKVVLSCTVQPDGTVANCQVVEETPAGHGFGQAALKMSSRFRMRPQTSDGHPVGGAVVRIPIKFEPSLIGLFLAAQAAEPPANPVIVKPQWIAKPTGSAVSRAFPDLAMRLAIKGRTTLSCEGAATGEVINCQIVSETPAGMGFGAAGLVLSRDFKMTPAMENGQPVGGATVKIPLSFSPPDISASGYPAAYRTAVSCITWNRARLDVLGDADTTASLAIAEREARARGKVEGVSQAQMDADIAAAGQGGQAARDAMSRIPFGSETCLFPRVEATTKGVVTSPTPGPGQADFGVVLLRCVADYQKRRVQDCKVLREEPAGQGLGDAALEAAPRMGLPARYQPRNGEASGVIEFELRRRADE